MPPESLSLAPKNFDAQKTIIQTPRTAGIEGENKVGIDYLSNLLGIDATYLKTIFSPAAQGIDGHVQQSFIFGSADRLGDRYTLLQEGSLLYLERVRDGKKVRKEIPKTFIYPDFIELPKIFSQYIVTRKSGLYEIILPNGMPQKISQKHFYDRILPEMRRQQELFELHCQTRLSLTALSRACSAEGRGFDALNPNHQKYAVGPLIPDWNQQKNPPATVVARGD